MSIPQATIMINKAIKIAKKTMKSGLPKEHYNNTKEVFNYSWAGFQSDQRSLVHLDKILKKIKTIIFSWLDTYLLENSKFKQKENFQLTKEDFVAIGFNFDTEVHSEQTYYCQDFVFYLLNEVKAFSYLFDLKNNDWPEDIANNPLTFFPSWGYERVIQPEKGDLVIYCTNEPKLKVKHFAIWISNERVVSKFGCWSVVEHSLSDVIIAYGCFVFFFRKVIKTSFTNDAFHSLTFLMDANMLMTVKGYARRYF